MTRARGIALCTLAALGGCAGLKSADGTGAPVDAAAPAPDGSEPGDGLDASGSGDGGADASDDAPADGAGPVRLVFVTTAKVNGAFAGAASPWAAADAICATEAVANSLSGTFIAWLSYTDSIGTSFNAGTRITDAAYSLPADIADGGAPVLVAASKAELLSSGPRVPLDRYANGARADRDENDYVTWVWTGTDGVGAASSMTCSRWTSADASAAGVAGNARRIPQYSPTDWTSLGGRTCDLVRRLYCFQK